MNSLRLCGVCYRNFLAYASRDFGGGFYCTDCLARGFEYFDPQPGSVSQGTVEMISGGSPGTYVVLAREGDMLTVRRQGFPEDPVSKISVGSVYWGAGGYPSKAWEGAGKKRKKRKKEGN